MHHLCNVKQDIKQDIKNTLKADSKLLKAFVKTPIGKVTTLGIGTVTLVGLATVNKDNIRPRLNNMLNNAQKNLDNIKAHIEVKKYTELMKKNIKKSINNLSAQIQKYKSSKEKGE